MEKDKAIMDAAKQYVDSTSAFYLDVPSKCTLSSYSDKDISEAFVAGANWVFGNILKKLWHSANEMPIIKGKECCVSCLVVYKNLSIELCTYYPTLRVWNSQLSDDDFKKNIVSWLYVDDVINLTK